MPTPPKHASAAFGAGSGEAPPVATASDSEPRWIFGYGSLMWRPGFAFLERRKAHLPGYHRAFCRYSFRHRGTPERPGLVIGLRDEALPPAGGAVRGTGTTRPPIWPNGGGCTGIAFWPDPAQLAETIAVLDEREGSGYHRVLRRLDFPDGNGRTPTTGKAEDPGLAWVYVPNPEHPSYFGETDPGRIVELILQGRGESGTAYDYLVAMLGELRAMNVAEPELEAILARVEVERKRNA
jgi:cation transport protein ChaC